MAWIQTVDESEASGIVKEEYDAAVARAGQLYNIVRLFSNRIADAFGIELDDFLELRRDFNESNG